MNCFMAYSMMWAFGGSYETETQKFKIDNIIQSEFTKAKFVGSESCFNFFFDPKTVKATHWNELLPEFVHDPKQPYFSILVPTVDTEKHKKLLDILIEVKKPVFLTGKTGVGKSVLVHNFIAENREEKRLNPFFLNFSAQTDSLTTQQTIESKLEIVGGGNTKGSAGGKTTIIFVDDVNMPMVEKFGAQPPIELL